jgi:ABC-type transporter Mla subunit MlaD
VADDILTPAAEALVKTLLEFRQQAADATGTFTELREAVEEHEQGLDEDWDAFTEAVRSLLATVAERDGELGPKGEQVGSAVEQLGSVIPLVHESLAEGLRENAEQLEGLMDQAQDADVEAERFVSEGTEALAGKIGAQLDKVAEGVETTAEEGVRSIREGFVEQAEVTAFEAGALVKEAKKVLTENATWVKQAVVVWTSQMTKVEDQVALESFRKAGPHVVQVVEHALGTYAEAQQTALEEVERLVGEARQQLASLEAAVKEADGDLDGASDQAQSQTGEFLIAMSEATEALQRVARLMTDYGVM